MASGGEGRLDGCRGYLAAKDVHVHGALPDKSQSVSQNLSQVIVVVVVDAVVVIDRKDTRWRKLTNNFAISFNVNDRKHVMLSQSVVFC